MKSKMAKQSKGKKKGIEYSEISSAKITENRCIVISDCSHGGFTVAQRMDVTENNHTNKIYMKGAFHINDIHGLYELRDACNLAIQMIEERESDDADWDE